MEEANQILHKTGEKLGVTLQQVRRTTMQASEKVQSCFDARLGSLIAGVIISVTSGIAVLGTIGGLTFVNVITNMGYSLDFRRISNHTFQFDEVMALLIANAVFSSGLIISLAEFSFAVVLAVGASQKKTGHLKAYFVYGNVKSIVLFIASIGMFIIVCDNALALLNLLLCGINVLITLMVYKAYKIMKKSDEGYNKFDHEVPMQE